MSCGFVCTTAGLEELQDRVPSGFTLACMCVSVCVCALYVCIHAYMCVSASAFVRRSCGGQQPMSDVFLYHSLLYFFQAVIHCKTSWPVSFRQHPSLPLQCQNYRDALFSWVLGLELRSSCLYADTLSLKHHSSPPLFLFVVHFKCVSNCFLVSFFKISFFTLSAGNQVFKLILPQLPRKDDIQR